MGIFMEIIGPFCAWNASRRRTRNISIFLFKCSYFFYF